MLHILRPVGILRKHWKLSIAAIFSLSIALMLGVVALSIGNTFLLLPPAGADPGRLVMIYAENPGEDSNHISYPDYEYFRKNNTYLPTSPEARTRSEFHLIEVQTAR